MLVQVGQALLIEVKLPDQNSGAFPRARLFDNDGTELAASPVSLSHVADGLYRYTGAAIAMPNKDFVTSIIQIFEDAGFTNPSELYADAAGCFTKGDDYIKTAVVVPRSDEIFVEFDSVEMEVLFEESEIEVVFDTVEIDVLIEENDIDVELDEGDILVELDC